MELLALIALGWWLAAPDRFTAAARTAAGTGLRAAGTGARTHWQAGRDGRELGRTARRDRWHKRGGWWRKLLGLERGAVVTGKAAKGTGKLAGATVRPVPGAIRDGWRKGQDRHQARTAGRPVPVALDPPWWRKPDPQDGSGQEAPPADDRTVRPGTADGTGAGQPKGEPVPRIDHDSPARTPFFPDAPDGPVLDDEADIRARNPELAWINPDPLTEGERRFRHLRDRGYPGALDQDGWPAPDFHTGAIVNPMPYLRQPPVPATATTNGAPMTTWQAKQEYGPDWAHAMTRNIPDYTPAAGGSMPAPTELRTHVAVQDFAQQVDAMSEASDFVVVAEKAREVGKQSRAGGFGAEMDSAVDSLEETARQFALAVDSLRAQAHKYAQTSLSVQGS